jgi:hypothetical protein
VGEIVFEDALLGLLEWEDEGEDCPRSEYLERVSDLFANVEVEGFGGMRTLSWRGYEQVQGRVGAPSCSSSGSARGSR